MNTHLATKVSNSSLKCRTRGAVKPISCSLISLKPPETLARSELSKKLAKTDSESDWQQVSYKKKSVKSATKQATIIEWRQGTGKLRGQRGVYREQVGKEAGRTQKGG